MVRLENLTVKNTQGQTLHLYIDQENHITLSTDDKDAGFTLENTQEVHNLCLILGGLFKTISE
jgi:hypothetical protein